MNHIAKYWNEAISMSHKKYCNCVNNQEAAKLLSSVLKNMEKFVSKRIRESCHSSISSAFHLAENDYGENMAKLRK